MEAQTKRSYETIFIVNATLDDAQIDHLIERFKEFLAKQGSEVVSIENWGRKRLAYPIQKKNNGFYLLCEFSAPPDIVSKLERYYTLEENIMRFLTVQLTEKALRARKEKTDAEKAEPSADQPKPEQKPTRSADDAAGEKTKV